MSKFVVVVFPDEAKASEGLHAFKELHCTEFDPAAYRKRNVALRFRDSAARLLSPLL